MPRIPPGRVYRGREWTEVFTTRERCREVGFPDRCRRTITTRDPRSVGEYQKTGMTVEVFVRDEIVETDLVGPT